MAVTSDVVAQGTLTASATTLRTGGGTENHVITFYNYHASARVVTVWLNGSADANLVAQIEIDGAGGFAIFHCKLGSGDTIQAKASAATSVTWTDEMDSLS